jgi:HemY protein
MRGAVWIVLIFAVAVLAASTLGRNDGLVAIYFGAWRADLSLNLFVLLVLAACFALVTAYRLIESIATLPRRAAEWRALQRERAAERNLREAQAEFFAARYSRAQRAAQRALQLQADTPGLQGDAHFALVARLLAAASLHRLQDRTQRDALMAGALDQVAPGSAGEGARLLAAEWALEDRDAERAMQLLAALPRGVARRTQALKLKLQATRALHAPGKALPLARLLAKHQGFSAPAARSLVRALATEAIDASHDIDQLRTQWRALDTAEQDDPIIAARAARRAAALGMPAEARTWLEPLWRRMAQLDAEEKFEITLALADAASNAEPDWLAAVELAAGQRPTDPALAFAAGTLYAERGLWGKARAPLEQAAQSPQLDARTRRRAWAALAGLAREEGDAARAARCDRAAVELS